MQKDEISKGDDCCPYQCFNSKQKQSVNKY